MIRKPLHLIKILQNRGSHQNVSKSVKNFSKQSLYHKIYKKLQSGCKRQDFLAFCEEILEVNEKELILELLRGCGLWIVEDSKNVSLDLSLHYQECEYCFVDIETTGSKPIESSVIEIGAIKYFRGKIIDRFETLVYANKIPEEITQLTGIDTKMLQNSPSEKYALLELRKFLGNSVFVAHNVAFDYNFISSRLEKYGDYGLLNPRICSVELAQKSILSPRYSLSFLNEFLGVNAPASHRAYADAFVCMRVFEIALLNLPKEVYSLKDLIVFSRGKRL